MAKKKTIEDIIKKNNVTPEEFEAAIEIIHRKHQNPTIHTTHIGGNKKHIRIGVLSDTHIGSKYFDPKALEIFINKCQDRGVDFYVHVGDVLEGHYSHREGHVFELSSIGMAGQLKELNEKFPDLKGIPMYFITGNHDETYINKAGVNIGKEIEAIRDEFKFIGHREGDIMLPGNTSLKMMHPDGGASYALSYRLQKIIESLSGGEKPKLLLVGHVHKYTKLFYRNVHAWHTGCFQSQTGFMRGKHLPAHKSGFIIDVTSNKGGVSELHEELIPFYE